LGQPRPGTAKTRVSHALALPRRAIAAGNTHGNKAANPNSPASVIAFAWLLVPTQRAAAAVPLYRAARADLHLRPENLDLYAPFTSAKASTVAIADYRADKEKAATGVITAPTDRCTSFVAGLFADPATLRPSFASLPLCRDRHRYTKSRARRTGGSHGPRSACPSPASVPHASVATTSSPRSTRKEDMLHVRVCLAISSFGGPQNSECSAALSKPAAAASCTPQNLRRSRSKQRYHALGRPLHQGFSGKEFQ
jgi:predicted component of type VI protein secretion system